MLTQAGVPVDDLAGLSGKQTTTTTIDFGRIDLPGIALYLFGTPGQARFHVLWDDLVRGALGALVLVDTHPRRFEGVWPVLDLVESSGIRYAVAVNRFDDAPKHTLEYVRDRLDLESRTPVVSCDARDRVSSRAALITLMEHIRELVLT
ncbi:ATP/GTP-binding protein [Streptomyces sp. FXJ1.4098]|nr:ATP/GTP-binding protein [Streptomyces sp. FXJ1.4098]